MLFTSAASHDPLPGHYKPISLTLLSASLSSPSFLTGNVLITLAGFPTTTLRGGTLLVTTDPAPTVDPAPMVTPPRMVTLPPSQTLSSVDDEDRGRTSVG